MSNVTSNDPSDYYRISKVLGRRPGSSDRAVTDAIRWLHKHVPHFQIDGEGQHGWGVRVLWGSSLAGRPYFTGNTLIGALANALERTAYQMSKLDSELKQWASLDDGIDDLDAPTGRG